MREECRAGAVGVARAGREEDLDDRLLLEGPVHHLEAQTQPAVRAVPGELRPHLILHLLHEVDDHLRVEEAVGHVGHRHVHLDGVAGGVDVQRLVAPLGRPARVERREAEAVHRVALARLPSLPAADRDAEVVVELAAEVAARHLARHEAVADANARSARLRVEAARDRLLALAARPEHEVVVRRTARYEPRDLLVGSDLDVRPIDAPAVRPEGEVVVVDRVRGQETRHAHLRDALRADRPDEAVEPARPRLEEHSARGNVLEERAPLARAGRGDDRLVVR